MLRWVFAPAVGGPRRGAAVFRLVLSRLYARYRDSELVGAAADWAGRVRGGDPAPDGRIRSSTSNEDMWLLEILRPPTYHLVVFSGLHYHDDDDASSGISSVSSSSCSSRRGGGGSSSSSRVMTPRDLERLVQCFGQHNTNERGAVHVVYAPGSKGAHGCYFDVTKRLHKRYGFRKRGGYVVVRPDGYVEFVGHLHQLSDLQNWLERRQALTAARM